MSAPNPVELSYASPGFLRDTLRVAKKDLLIEFRTRSAFIAAAVFAAEAIRRAGIDLMGSIEISGTVDEESGGFAGAAWLAHHGRLTSERVDYVIIPEPLNVDRICIGHRGVYWFEVTTRGRIGHGSMPFLGVNAIEGMGRLLQSVRDVLMQADSPDAFHQVLVEAEER